MCLVQERLTESINFQADFEFSFFFTRLFSISKQESLVSLAI